MSSNHRLKSQYFLSSYPFYHPVLLSTKAFLPFPGVYALYIKTPITGHLKLRYIGQSDHLDSKISVKDAIVQKLLSEVHGNKDLIYYAYHIELNEANRLKISRELIQHYSPFYNLRQNQAVSQGFSQSVTPSTPSVVEPQEHAPEKPLEKINAVFSVDTLEGVS
jgi:hypothetical protein